MKEFVSVPHLPSRVHSLALGEKYAEILKIPLKSRGISPVFVPDNPFVDKRLSGHADLSFFHAGGERVFLAPYLQGSSFAEKLSALGAEVSFPAIKQGKKYPKDAQMNACVIGNRFLYSPQNTCSEIVDYLTNKRKALLVPVRQSYVKCSICVLDANSFITADGGIAKAAQKVGLDVLLISQGYIDLPGFDYGFIGGASFRISERCIAFTGVLNRHPDKDRIMAFLHAHGFDAVFLTDRTIFDIGSAFPILEY